LPAGSGYIAEADLAALASNDYSDELIQRLRAFESAKHSFLIEAVRRTVLSGPGRAEADVVEAAAAVLADVQAHAPEVAARILELPHIGFWAIDCLSRMRQLPVGRPPGSSAPSRLEIARLAQFAAVAAVRAGRPFSLAVPMLDGAVALPTMGTAHVGPRGRSGWARVRLDRDAAVVTAGHAVLELPAGSAQESRHGLVSWVPSPRLTAQAEGLTLNVLLEASDPLLSFLGSPMPAARRPSQREWHTRVAAAWRILARSDGRKAGAISAGLTTLVPIPCGADGQLMSASSGWAWGAIALSMPADAFSLAEVLVHEFHHHLLSAVEDLVPLVRGDGNRLYYAPWRDDPRPLRSLFQGAYAYLGVTGFWRRLCRAGPPEQRLRAEVEFARRLRNTVEATGVLAESSALTDAGSSFIASMRERLSGWQDETVSAEAKAKASYLVGEHRTRWLRAHRRLSSSWARYPG